MNILVTGARGFVGRGLIPYLSRSGVVGVATGRSPPIELPAGWLGVSRVNVINDSRHLPTIDAIVHMEVKQHVPRPTHKDEMEFEQANVGTTREWLDWATRHGVEQFVFLSSIKAVQSATSPQSETAPLAPNTAYGRSKAAAERLVTAWAAGDVKRRAIILRPAPVYGPGNEANLAAFVRHIVSGKPCLIGAGNTRKSIVSRTNLAGAIAFVTSRQLPGCEVYNVSDRDTPSLAELASLIATLASAPPPRRIPLTLARVLAPIGDLVASVTGRDFPLTTARLSATQETSVFPSDKLVSHGFQHPQTTCQGIQEMLEWMKSTD